jgi:hypothetical protein
VSTEVTENEVVLDADAVDVAEGWVKSNLPRIVALMTPFFVATVTAGSVWLQNVVGIDLQRYNGAVVAFIAVVALGALSIAVTWLFNAGQGQIKLGLKLISDVYTLPPGEFDPDQVRDVVARDTTLPNVPDEDDESAAQRRGFKAPDRHAKSGDPVTPPGADPKHRS